MCSRRLRNTPFRRFACSALICRLWVWSALSSMESMLRSLKQIIHRYLCLSALKELSQSWYMSSFPNIVQKARVFCIHRADTGGKCKSYWKIYTLWELLPGKCKSRDRVRGQLSPRTILSFCFTPLIWIVLS